MASGKLGKPAKISYKSKNATSGLIDIILTVKRPDGVDVGPFPLVEYRPGYYKHDFITVENGIEGDYLGFIESPSESHTQQVKFSLFKPINLTGGNVQISACEPLIGMVGRTKLIGFAKKVEPLIGKISNKKLIGQAEGVEPLKGKVNNLNLKGITNKEC